MTLEEFLIYDLTGLNVLIIGRPGSGKTALSMILGPMNPHHMVINTDDYLYIGGERAVEAIIEDQSFTPPTIIEGMMGYPLLLEGAKRKCYTPDIVIEVVISRGRQRKIYIAERSPEKIRALEWAHLKNVAILNEYHKLVPEENKPLWVKLENNYAVKNPY